MKRRTMVTRICFYLLVILVVPPRAQSAEEIEKLRLAVFPFARQAVQVKQETAQVRRELITALERTGRFNIMRDETMTSISQEIGFTNLDQCTTSTCGAYFGGLLGVQQVLLGSVEQSPSGLSLRLQLLAVTDKKILFEQTTVVGDILADLSHSHFDKLAKDLAASTFGSSSKYKWYYIGGAALGFGTLVYLISQGIIFSSKSKVATEDESGKQGPPSDGK